MVFGLWQDKCSTEKSLCYMQKLQKRGRRRESKPALQFILKKGAERHGNRITNQIPFCHSFDSPSKQLQWRKVQMGSVCDEIQHAWLSAHCFPHKAYYLWSHYLQHATGRPASFKTSELGQTESRSHPLPAQDLLDHYPQPRCCEAHSTEGETEPSLLSDWVST